MVSRRGFLGFSILSLAVSGDAGATARKKKTAARKAKKPFRVADKWRPQVVEYRSRYRPGTIVIDTGSRFLYLIEGPRSARRYGVGVGKDALAWSGVARVGMKREWPRWQPTVAMIEREPEKYAQYAEGMDGGPGNPLGARAMYLFQGRRDTEYRIHGTTQPWTIGTASSNGCIRMVNDHVIDLYARVRVGAKVIVR
jgi:lipoprotein-anchoring transpeptidase ErfK/SrfK